MDQKSLPPRLSRIEASAYLLQKHGISRSPGYLAKLATHGGGPAFRKAGTRAVVYDVEELDRWAESITHEPVSSTSERPAKKAEAAPPIQTRARSKADGVEISLTAFLPAGNSIDEIIAALEFIRDTKEAGKHGAMLDLMQITDFNFRVVSVDGSDDF